ncbi:hypothetical protein [Pedobacter aquatilis]|uniref:hypothetical protein n=1 Tax=Pedobacter aquatilis TaxID=351343 RepID=UPI00292F8C8A|nr:hypothetical protein [Pedobacter aquatilis]
MKTPLTPTLAYIQVPGRKAKVSGDGRTTMIIEKAHWQIRKMTTLIIGFLDVSRLESGKIYIDRKHFDMAMLVKEVEEGIVTESGATRVIFAPREET